MNRLTRVIDGRDDEASIGQRLGHVAMADEGPAETMRDHHQRQVPTGDGTISRCPHRH